VQRWYSLPTGEYKGSFQDASAQFRVMLEDAVKVRLTADVPVGVTLSGGLDSSSIVCVGRDQVTKTFSAYSLHQRYDERRFVETVIEHTGVEGYSTSPQLDDLLSTLDQLIWHQDEPFGSSSIFAQWEVFKLARKHAVKVILSGQGADEQLAGYRIYFFMLWHELLTQGRLTDLSSEIRMCRQLHGITHCYRRLLYDALPHVLKAQVRRWLKKGANDSWLNLKGDLVDLRVGHAKTISQLSYEQITRSHLPMLLHFEDRSSMAHSIESRTPFIDYRLVEFLQSLPSHFKIGQGMTKKVMREGLKGRLVESVRQRVDKLAFDTPEEVWVRHEKPAVFKQLVAEAVEESRGVLNHQAIALADDVIDGNVPFDFYVWRVIVFGRWMKRFQVDV
jgi:asparagine synthase (glutamine-hydrolysing)